MNCFDTPYNITTGKVVETMMNEGKTEQEIFDAFGLTKYPIFDEEHRAKLNWLIIHNYWCYKLAFETMALQKMQTEVFMDLNMPYFNEMYKTTGLELNPLYTTDVTETYKASGKTNEKTSGTSSDTREDDLHTSGNVTSNDTRTDALSEVVTNTGKKTGTEGTVETGENSTDNTSTATNKTTGSDTNKTTEDNTRANYSMPNSGVSGSDAWGDKYVNTGEKDKNSHLVEDKTTSDSTGNTTEKGKTTVSNNATTTHNVTDTLEGEKTNTGTQKNTGSSTSTGSQTGTVTSNGTNAASSDGTHSDEYEKIIRGYNGNAAELLMKWRAAIITIDKDIVETCSALFGFLY